MDNDNFSIIANNYHLAIFAWGFAAGILYMIIFSKEKPKLTKGKIIMMSVIVVLTGLQILFVHQIERFLF